MSKETEMKLNEIRKIEDKYGLTCFHMGLIHLADVGIRNLDDISVENGIKELLSQEEADEAKSIITPGFLCEVLRCSGELAKFSPLTLFRYFKEHVVINNQEWSEANAEK